MDERATAMINLLASQRNQALDAFVECAGELAVVRASFAALEAEIEELKAGRDAAG